jgi:hypothetical protein
VSPLAKCALALATVTPFAFSGCLDERELKPYPIVFFGGATGNEAGMAGEATGGSNGGSSGSSSGGKSSGGTASTGGSNSGGSGGSNGGSGGNEPDGGAGEPSLPCPDLNADGLPDCEQTLVSNGKFDVDSAGWMPQAGVERTWDAADAEERPDSGSLLLVNTAQGASADPLMVGASQCIAVTGSTTSRFTVAAQVYIESGQEVSGSAGVNVIFWSLPGCEGSNLKQKNGVRAETGDWYLAFAEESSTFETHSISVRLVVVKPANAPRFEARIDNVLVIPR